MTQTLQDSVPALRFPEFSGEWEIKRLQDVTIFQNGKAHEQNIRSDGSFVVVNSKFISTEGRVRKFVETQISPLFVDDIVMVMSDIPKGKALAKCYLIEKDDLYSLNQRICLLRAHDADTYYLFLVTNRNDYFLKFDSGVTQTNLRKDEILWCPAHFPSLPEQQKIASFLSSVDTKINQLGKKKALLEKYKKGMMQKLFSQALRFKDAQGNDFPDWEEKSIGEFVKSHRGGAPLRPSDFVAKGTHLVFPKKYIVAGGKLAVANAVTYCTDEFFSRNSNSVINSKYLVTTLRDLVPSGPTIGFIVEYHGSETYLLAQGVYGLLINEEQLEKSFFIQFSNTPIYRKWMQKIKVGSTQVHIRMGDFKNVPFFIPKLPEQQKIADFLSALDRKIELIDTELKHAQAFKKGLLQQMFV